MTHAAPVASGAESALGAEEGPMIPPPHWVFGPDRLSVRCQCGAWPKQPHVIGLEYFCGPGCCPVCNPAEPADVTGMVGVQEEML